MWLMDKLKKALQDLAKAVESNNCVETVKITITLTKPSKTKVKVNK